MKPIALLFFGTSLLAGSLPGQEAPSRPLIDTSESPYAVLRPVPMQDTAYTGGFWADRFDLVTDKMVPTMEHVMLEYSVANLKCLKYAAGLIDEPQRSCHWSDGDNFKWIETMVHVYSKNKDPELDAKMDEWIEIIAKAQEADGYISTNITTSDLKRFDKVKHHELYNMGHMLTTACMHYRVTGKDNFFKLGIKLADFLVKQWGAEPVKMSRFPWNPSVFMAMADMYRETKNPAYLDLLKTMIANRGSNPNPNRDNGSGGTDQTQDRVPLHLENYAVGHAVTGNYLYCGAADLYAEIGDPEILAALERIWKDIHYKKADITLGVAMDRNSNSLSPRGDEVHENFANAPYQQPNGYSETCANIATGMFSYRMFLITGKAEYANWAERMLYNTLHSGVDLAGERFFYCNPTSWDGAEGTTIKQTNRERKKDVPYHLSPERWSYMNCYCCPPSVARTTAKVHNWFYNLTDDGDLLVNFYGATSLSTQLSDGSPIALKQETDFPWDGAITVDIEVAPADRPFGIHFRMPPWTENPTVVVNGIATALKPVVGDYFEVYRYWAAGDKVEINLPMPVRVMEPNPKIKKLDHRVAVMRGPVVYCMEIPNSEGGRKLKAEGIFLPENASFTAEYRDDFLGGVTVLKTTALNYQGVNAYQRMNQIDPMEPTRVWSEDELFRPKAAVARVLPDAGLIELELIPYYAWANRGIAVMDVYMPLATDPDIVGHLDYEM